MVIDVVKQVIQRHPEVQNEGIPECWGNSNNLRAPYSCIVVGPEYNTFDPVKFDHRGKDRHKHWVNLPERYGKPIKFKYKKGDESFDLNPTTLEQLRQRFQKSHDILWQGGKRNPAQAFDEMTKLMFCKLHDERWGTADSEAYSFQIGPEGPIVRRITVRAPI